MSFTLTNYKHWYCKINPDAKTYPYLAYRWRWRFTHGYRYQQFQQVRAKSKQALYEKIDKRETKEKDITSSFSAITEFKDIFGAMPEITDEEIASISSS